MSPRGATAFPLDMGVDASTDLKIGAALTELENARYERRNRISKRLGQQTLALPTGSIAGPRLYPYGDAVLNIGEQLQTYQPAQNTWATDAVRHTFRHGRYTWRDLPITSTTAGPKADYAELGNIAVAAYQDEITGYVHVTVLDRITQTLLTAWDTGSAGGVIRGFKLVSLSSASRVMLYYFTASAALGFTAFSSVTGARITSGFGSPPSPTQHATRYALDACAVPNGGSNRAVMVYVDSAGDVGIIIHDGGSTWATATITVTADDAKLLACWQQTDTTWGLSWVYNTSGAWHVTTVNLSGSPVTADITVTVAAGGTNRQLTGCKNTTGAIGTAHVYLCRFASDVWDGGNTPEPEILYHRYDASGTGSAVWARYYLAGKAAPYGTTQVDHVVPLCCRHHLSLTQAHKVTDTLLVMGNDNVVMTRAAIRRAHYTGVESTSTPPIQDHLANFEPVVGGGGLATTVPVLADDDFLITAKVAGNITSLSRFELRTSQLDHKLTSAQTADVLHLGNGCPAAFDGYQIGEQGFHAFPGMLALWASAAGAVTAGERKYRACYARMNARGQVARSAASPFPLSVTFAASTKKTIRMCGYFGSQHNLGGAAAGWIELYRTVAGGTIYYLVARVAHPTLTSTWKVDYEDNTLDADLTQREVLYTASETDNVPVPAHDAVATWDGRHWIYDYEQRRLQYSKRYAPGAQVAFAAANVVQPEPAMGVVVAMAAAVDKLILWTDGQIWIQEGLGTGLASSGQGTPYQPPWLLSSAIGCSNPLTVARVPAGWMFLGSDGLIWLLTHSLELRPMIAARGLLAGVAVQQAAALPAQHLVVFITTYGSSSSPALVYDWLHDAWCIWRNWGGSSALAVGGRLYRYDASAGFHRMYADGEANSFSDGSADTHVPLKIVSGWMLLNGLLGQGGDYRVAVLGEIKSAHTLRCKLSFDYATSHTDNKTLASSSVGSQPYLLQIQPSQHRTATAIKVSLEDEQAGPEAGQPYSEAYSLSAVGIETDAHDGLRQVGDERSF